MILYAVTLSPYAARVRLALRVKGLDYDMQPPPGGSTRSPEYLATRDQAVVTAEIDRWRDGLALADHFIQDGAFAVGSAISKADCILLPSLLLCGTVADIFGLGDPIAQWTRLAGYREKARRHPDMGAIWTKTEEALAAMRAAA